MGTEWQKRSKSPAVHTDCTGKIGVWSEPSDNSRNKVRLESLSKHSRDVSLRDSFSKPSWRTTSTSMTALDSATAVSGPRLEQSDTMLYEMKRGQTFGGFPHLNVTRVLLTRPLEEFMVGCALVSQRTIPLCPVFASPKEHFFGR